MSQNHCIVCSEIVAVTSISDFIQCIGPCKLFTHQKCSGIPKSSVKLFNELPNVHYYCTVCNVTVKEFRESLADIRASIDKLSDRVENHTTVAAASSSFPTLLESVEMPRNNKRRRTDVPIATERSIPNTAASPRVPPRRNLCVGSTVCDSLKSVEQRKSIVATMFHPSTQSTELAKFIAGKLNLDADSPTIRCSLLLPKDKTVADLNWVSFRVSVPESSFEALQDAALWPKGVMVREFVYRPRRFASQPTVAHLHPAPDPSSPSSS